jgi:aryl-alcohol dehydrogenase
MKIKAALETGDGSFRITDVDLEAPRDDEILVAVAGCGICHTDAAMRGAGFLLGHETSGVVARVGQAVRGLARGDPVALSYTSCGECPACRDGRAYACYYLDTFFDGRRRDDSTPLSRDGQPLAGLMRQGGFSTHVVCHRRAATKVDTGLDLRLLGPLGCGIITGAGAVLNCLKPAPGKPLAVFGAGGVGLSAVMAARLAGCNPIIAVDRIPSRLALALELGATHAIDSGATDDLAGAVRAASGGIDYGFDTSGDHGLLEALRAALNPGGAACGVGIDGGLHLTAAERRSGKTWESPTAGWSAPGQFIPFLLAKYAEGQFPFTRMIRTYPFAAINEAFHDMESGETVKPVLVMDAAPAQQRGRRTAPLTSAHTPRR